MHTNVVFHIGMHKTGTTWLQNTYFLNDKSYHLINDTISPWDDELLKNIIGVCDYDFHPYRSRKIIEQRAKEGVVNIVSAERLSGHPISGGYDMERIAKRIFRIAPESKILITIRDIEPFIKSIYKQMIREGYCGNAKQFLFGNNWKTAIVSKDYFKQTQIVEKYKTLFGKEQVLILDFDEFRDDKGSYISKIEAFLNIQSKLERSFQNTEIANKSFSNRRIRALRSLNKFRRSEINPFPVFSLHRKGIIALSKLFGPLYSNKPLIKQESIDKYLS